MTRSRSSTEYGFGIVQPPKAESMPTDSPINSPLGIPRFYWEPSDSIRPKHALEVPHYTSNIEDAITLKDHILRSLADDPKARRLIIEEILDAHYISRWRA